MEAYHFRAPTAAELEASGLKLKPEHYPEPEVTVWQDLWRSFEIYMRLQSQWRCGPSGPLGLDFTVLYPELARLQITGEAWDETMWHLRLIESEALKRLQEG